MFSQYERLNVHYSESDIAVIRKARKMLSPLGKSVAQRKVRKEWYKQILEYHHEWRSTVRWMR